MKPQKLSVYPSVLSVYLSINLSIYAPIYVSIYRFICLTKYLLSISMHTYILSSTYPFNLMHPPIHQSMPSVRP